MKTISLYLLIVLVGLTSVYAQESKDDSGMRGQKREKIKAQKVAFITSNLDLTPEEAQLFWPVYNEYNKKLDEIASERMKLMKEATKKLTELTEKEAESFGDKIVEFEIAEANLRKDYHAKFKKVLPKNKILKLYQSEHKFKKQLLRDIKGKHHNQKGEQGNKTE